MINFITMLSIFTQRLLVRKPTRWEWDELFIICKWESHTNGNPTSYKY